MKPITDICLNITENCNLNCRYCFTNHSKNTMSYEVARDTVDWIISNMKLADSDGSIGFFGGEPLLEWDNIIKPLTLYIREKVGNRIKLGITSNCTLLDENKIDFMKRHNIDLLVSIDGDRITQDYNRPCKNGKSSFDILNKKIKTISKNFPNSVFRSTLIPATCEHFCENLEYAQKSGFTLSFVIINQFENWDDNARNKTAKELRKYSNYLIKSFQQETPFIRQRTLEQAINKIIANNFLIKQKNRITFENGRPCGTGNGYGAVDFKGDIYSCQEVTSLKDKNNIFLIGNIYDGIDQKKLELLIEKTSLCSHIYNSNNPNKCETCPLEIGCDINSCLINNYLESGSFFYQSDNLCWWNNLLAGEAQYILNIMGSENNENFKKYLRFLLTSEGGCLNHV